MLFLFLEPFIWFLDWIGLLSTFSFALERTSAARYLLASTSDFELLLSELSFIHQQEILLEILNLNYLIIFSAILILDVLLVICSQILCRGCLDWSRREPIINIGSMKWKPCVGLSFEIIMAYGLIVMEYVSHTWKKMRLSRKDFPLLNWQN